MEPIISIITASYNNSKSLQRCIDSVKEQNSQIFEHLIVDGASQDGTVGILKKNADNIAWWISEPDTGIYEAWNKALVHARGEWLLFLGGDDQLATPHAMERVVPCLNKAYPAYRIVYGRINLLNASGGLLETLGAGWDDYKGKYEQGRIKLPPHPAVFHHKSVFHQRGFDESFRLAGDSEFLIQELKKHPALFIPETITDMTMGGTSGTPRNSLLRWKECRKAMKRHGLKMPPHILTWHRMKNLSEFLVFAALPTGKARQLADTLRLLLGEKKRWT
ncbi:MAG: glycosyltransferase family 2 protein [Spirochaetota bacterium]|nr:glycosyltransferase family 2 protein [Spirochaetota bacterium]